MQSTCPYNGKKKTWKDIGHAAIRTRYANGYLAGGWEWEREVTIFLWLFAFGVFWVFWIYGSCYWGWGTFIYERKIHWKEGEFVSFPKWPCWAIFVPSLPLPLSYFWVIVICFVKMPFGDMLPIIYNSVLPWKCPKCSINRIRFHFYLSLADEESGMKWFFHNSLHLSSTGDWHSGIPWVNLLKLTKPKPHSLL